MFFNALVKHDLEGMRPYFRSETWLEGQRFGSPGSAMAAWAQVLDSRRGIEYRLYNLEIFTPEQMEKRYGKPPARLTQLPWRGPRTFIAVANLSGRAAIAVFRVEGEAITLAGFTD
jgi:hypothetical protein